MIELSLEQEREVLEVLQLLERESLVHSAIADAQRKTVLALEQLEQANESGNSVLLYGY